jgi:hypothetical protein
MRRGIQHEFPNCHRLGVTVFVARIDIDSCFEILESDGPLVVSRHIDYRSFISLAHFHAIQLLALTEQKNETR